MFFRKTKKPGNERVMDWRNNSIVPERGVVIQTSLPKSHLRGTGWLIPMPIYGYVRSNRPEEGNHA